MDQTAILARLKPWLEYRASFLSRDPGTIQDLAQEALIAIWQEVQKADRDGRAVNESFLKQRAGWTMLNQLRKNLPVPTEAEDLMYLVGGAEQAISDDDITDAIKTLTLRQQEYVRLRFWVGLDNRELNRRGYGVGLWYDKSHGAREKLRKLLPHLV